MFKVGDLVEIKNSNIMGHIIKIKRFKETNVYIVRFLFFKEGCRYEERRIYIGEDELQACWGE